jgi:hypothetical protein
MAPLTADMEDDHAVRDSYQGRYRREPPLVPPWPFGLRLTHGLCPRTYGSCPPPPLGSGRWCGVVGWAR